MFKVVSGLLFAVLAAMMLITAVQADDWDDDWSKIPDIKDPGIDVIPWSSPAFGRSSFDDQMRQMQLRQMQQQSQDQMRQMQRQSQDQMRQMQQQLRASNQQIQDQTRRIQDQMRASNQQMQEQLRASNQQMRASNQQMQEQLRASNQRIQDQTRQLRDMQLAARMIQAPRLYELLQQQSRLSQTQMAARIMMAPDLYRMMRQPSFTMPSEFDLYRNQVRQTRGIILPRSPIWDHYLDYTNWPTP